MKTQTTKSLNEALGIITRSPAFTNGVLKDLVKVIAQIGLHTLGAYRLGIWNISKDMRILKNVTTYHRSVRSYIVQDDLDMSGHTEYIDILFERRALAINDIKASGLLGNYNPEICAILNAPIHINGKLAGVICIEQNQCDEFPEMREWTEAEQSFAASLADFMAIAITNEERRTLKQRTDAMVSNLPGMVYRSLNDHPNYTCTFASEGSLSLIGYTPEELVGNREFKYIDIVHPDSATNFLKACEESLALGLPLDCTYKIITKDGTEKWIWERSFIVDNNPDGTPYLVEGFYTDVTEQKRLEAIEHENQLKSKALDYAKLVLDTSPLICQLWDGNLELIERNEASIRFYGPKSEQCSLDQFIQEFSPEYQPDCQRSDAKAAMYLKQAFEEGYCVFDWMHQIPVTGELIPAKISLIRVDYEGDYFVVGYTEDLREHKRMLAEIEHHSSLLATLNEISILLLEPEVDKFEENLLRGIELLAKSLHADQVHIWKNNTDDCGAMYSTQLYRWSRDAKLPLNCESENRILHCKDVTLLRETLMQGKFLNGPVSDLPCEEQMVLKSANVRSVLVVPVLLQNGFWGFVSVGDCFSERKFTDNEVMIVRSASKLMVCALNRQRMVSTINQTQELLRTVKLAASSLLTADNRGCIESILSKNLELIGRAIDADRVQIWKNEMIGDDSHFVNTYDWVSDAGKLENPIPIGAKLSYKDIPEWEVVLSNDAVYSKRVSEMSQGDQDFLGSVGVKSMVTIPLFLKEQFWGLFSIDDCVRERVFTEEEIGILRSVSLMMVSTLEQKQMIAEIERQSSQLAMLNKISAILLNADADTFENDLRESMKFFADIVNVDCVHIWKNHLIDGVPHTSQIFEYSPWVTAYADGKIYSYEESTPEWYEILKSNNVVNGIVRTMSPTTQADLAKNNIKSIFVASVQYPTTY